MLTGNRVKETKGCYSTDSTTENLLAIGGITPLLPIKRSRFNLLLHLKVKVEFMVQQGELAHNMQEVQGWPIYRLPAQSFMSVEAANK